MAIASARAFPPAFAGRSFSFACSRSCIENCPAEETCAVAHTTEFAMVCSWRWDPQCRPCKQDTDCMRQAGPITHNHACIADDAGQDRCGFGCAGGGACPGGFTCKKVTRSNGLAAEVCMPTAAACAAETIE